MSINGAELGFEQTLWAAADKLRGHLDAADYKNVVLGLIFLKYISDAFSEQRDRLAQTEFAGKPPLESDQTKVERIARIDARRAPREELALH